MFYLREPGGQYVGPFRSRNDAENFIKLMELCGQDWADAEIVEDEERDSSASPPDSLR